MKKLLFILILSLTFSFASGQDLLLNIIADEGGAASGPPAFLTSDGDTWGWYIASETGTITKDATDSVRIWNDYLGGANNLSCTDNTKKQPIWSADGILFNGTTNTLTTGSKTLNQPVTYYIVAKQVTWTSLDALCDGYLGSACGIRQHTSTSRLSIYAPTYTTDNNTLATNTWGILTAVYSGANSFFQINDTDNGTENAGANNAGGYTVGSNGAGTNYWSNFQIKEIIVRKAADDGTERAAVKAYLKAKYGL